MEYLLFLLIGIAGNVIGTLVGGGGLITLPTMMLMGVPVHSAIGANKVSNMVSAFSSFYMIFRRKELTWVEMRSVLLVSLVGGTLGGLFASVLSGQTLTLIAIILLGFALVMSFIGGADFGDKESFTMNRINGPILLGVGFYDAYLALVAVHWRCIHMHIKKNNVHESSRPITCWCFCHVFRSCDYLYCDRQNTMVTNTCVNGRINYWCANWHCHCKEG